MSYTSMTYDWFLCESARNLRNFRLFSAFLNSLYFITRCFIMDLSSKIDLSSYKNRQLLPVYPCQNSLQINRIALVFEGIVPQEMQMLPRRWWNSPEQVQRLLIASCQLPDTGQATLTAASSCRRSPHWQSADHTGCWCPLLGRYAR